MICACICGKVDLAGREARSDGIWTIGNVACEYRTCSGCKSTRAFMYPNRIDGEMVISSSLLGGRECEFTSILDAVEYDPPHAFVELTRSGIVVARSVSTATGECIWRLLAPTTETPL